MSKKTITQTFNIIEIMKKYSLKQKVDVRYIDFNILDIAYIYKTSSSNKTISKEDILNLKGDKNSNNIINQKFKIELFRKDKVKFIISHKVLLNKSKTEAISVISPKSKIIYYENLEQDLINYFNKEKAKQKMIVSVFDDDMMSDIASLVAYVKDRNKIPKNAKITLSSKVSYTASIEDKLSYKYLPSNIRKQDLANCYCFVKAKQEVISYINGTKGTSGFDVYGKYMKAKDIRDKQELSFNLSDNLEIINTDMDSQVFSKIDGILVFKNGKFDIQNDISFNALDFKSVRYFDIPLENEDVVINIKSPREFENAINSGVTLKAHNINIIGDIDSNTTIVAVNLKCTGNIHHSAILRAKNAELRILKGKLKADTVKIKTIENGLIVANSIEVDSIVGGELRANEIKIKSLYSNNTIKCSKSLEITSMKGENNNIHMSMNASLKLKPEIKRYQQELLETKEIDPKNIPLIKRKYIEHKKKAKNFELQIKEGGKSIKEIQKNMLLNKNILDALEKDINAIEHKHNLISNLKKIDESLYQTKIILINGWNGDNILIYDYVHKEENITKAPEKSIKMISFVNANNRDIIKLI